MNKGVKSAPKNIRSAVTKNIISGLNAPKEELDFSAKLEARKAELAKKAALEARKNYKQAPKENKERAPKRSLEAQNARISWMNDITNAARSIKGLGKSVPSEWNSRDTLSKKSNAELWKIRGEATRLASEVNASKATKKSLSDKKSLMKGNGGEKTTLENGSIRIRKLKASKEALEDGLRSFKVSTVDHANATREVVYDVRATNEEEAINLVLEGDADISYENNWEIDDFSIESDYPTILYGDNGGEEGFATESANKKGSLKGRNFKFAGEAIKQSGVVSLSICPLCGSKEFNAKKDVCPVCGDSYKKYRAVEASELDWNDIDSNYTTIDVDGTEKVLLDEQGNTSVVSPDDIEGHLTEKTHMLVVKGEEDEEPVFIDSGVASEHAEPDGDEDEFGDEPGSNLDDDIAFIKIPMPIEECINMLQEDNEDSIEVVPTDTGYEIVVSLENAEPEEEEEEVEEPEEPEEVNEAEEPEFDEQEVSEDDFKMEDQMMDEEPVEDDGDEKVVLTLEELAEGTVIHSAGISNVQALVDILNQLLPETSEIVESSEDEEAKKEAKDAMEEDVEEMEEDKENAIKEDEDFMRKEPLPGEEEEKVEEAAKPKFGKLIKAKRKRLRDKKLAVKKGELASKVMESGTSKILFNGKVLEVKFKSVYEAKLPKVTKANPKTTGKVKAAGKPSAKSLAMTLEASKTKHDFMKVGQEALGSALNTRKLLLSLWDAIKENKPGSSKTLLNTLETALKPEAVEEKKSADKPKSKAKKLENKKIKKLDKVIKFKGKSEAK